MVIYTTDITDGGIEMIRRYKSTDLEKAAIALTQSFAEEPWKFLLH